jgi:transcriptional regulator with XRE-family HTH domain
MLDVMDRTQLADFLRRSRSRVRPADVGLSTGPRRRTPGLRREEVAMLAGISADYYIRLEQARGPHPSAQVLAAMARALRLTDDERDHLYRLAGQPPPALYAPSTHVRPGLLHLLDELRETPAQVISDLGETLAQNHLARALLGDQTRYSGRSRSFAWRWFTDPDARRLYPREDHEHHSRVQVADLRATAARRRTDADVVDLVRGLRAASPEFAERWDEHEVAVRRSDRKRIVHPQVGVVEVDCETLLTPEHDQRLLVFTAQPGTAAAEQLALIRVIGLQEFARP